MTLVFLHGLPDTANAMTNLAFQAAHRAHSDGDVVGSCSLECAQGTIKTNELGVQFCRTLQYKTPLFLDENLSRSIQQTGDLSSSYLWVSCTVPS